jgi:hypothetical protein
VVFELGVSDLKPVATYYSDKSDGVARDAFFKASASKDRLLGLSGDFEWVQDEALIAELDVIRGEESEMWFIGGEAPQIAQPVEQMGEGECGTGPILLSSGDGWVELPYEDSGCLELGRQGDWLFIEGSGNWAVFDLTTLEQTAVGRGFARFWPSDLALPRVLPAL